MLRKSYFPILGVALVILNLIAHGNPTPLERLLASLIILLSSVPTFQFIVRREGDIPFLPIFGWIYAIHYALPIFTLESFGFREWFFSNAIIERSLLICLFGLICTLVAFYLFPFFDKGKTLPKVNLHWEPSKVRQVAPLYGIVGLVASYILASRRLPGEIVQMVFFVACLSPLAMCMLFILQLQNKLTPLQGLFLWGFLFPAQLVIDLSTGAVYQVLKDMIPLMMIYWSLKRKIPWGAVLAGISILILLRGNGMEYRFLLATPEYEGAGVPERSLLFVQVVADNTKERGVLGAYVVTLERLAHLLVLADVIEQTPEIIPYWHGETYMTLLTSLIPRFLWPDKPTKEVGHIFGHRYGRLHPEDEVTSENLPQIVEMYANFGTIFVLIGTFLVGFIYRFLYVLINRPEAGEGCLATSAVIFTSLLSIESDFSLNFGSVIQFIFLLFLVLRPLRLKTSQPFVIRERLREAV